MESSVNTSRDTQKRAVIRMAGQLFSEYGIRKVKMDDVAAALSMSKRTLYEMFKDKEELLLECAKVSQAEKHEHAQHVVATSDNVLEIVVRIYQDGMSKLRKMNPRLFEDVKRYPALCEYIRAHREESAENTMAFFEAGVKQGLFRADINYQLFHHIMAMVMDGSLSETMTGKWPLTEVLEVLFCVNMRGICTEKGVRLFDEFLAKNHLQ